MVWPVVLSVPHAGLDVPAELTGRHRLTEDEIRADGDEGAAEIYLPLAAEAAGFVSTPIARAFVDMNRAEDDIRRDGVVKTHTCWDVPVYDTPLSEEETQGLLQSYHRPYHAALARAAEGVRLGLDLHTMAAHGPPVGPDPGVERPWICLGDARGAACDPAWTRALQQRLQASLGVSHVTYNAPFSGGYITRSRPGGLPWIQIEMSRGDWASPADKRAVLRAALSDWLDEVLYA